MTWNFGDVARGEVPGCARTRLLTQQISESLQLCRQRTFCLYCCNVNAHGWMLNIRLFQHFRTEYAVPASNRHLTTTFARAGAFISRAHQGSSFEVRLVQVRMDQRMLGASQRAGEASKFEAPVVPWLTEEGRIHQETTLGSRLADSEAQSSPNVPSAHDHNCGWATSH